MRNSNDLAIAVPNTKPYFNIRSVQCFIMSDRMNWCNKLLQFSILVYAMACLWSWSILYTSMDSNAADGMFKYS